MYFRGLSNAFDNFAIVSVNWFFSLWAIWVPQTMNSVDVPKRLLWMKTSKEAIIDENDFGYPWEKIKLIIN